MKDPVRGKTGILIGTVEIFYTQQPHFPRWSEKEQLLTE
jgi:hypothetical protein